MPSPAETKKAKQDAYNEWREDNPLKKYRTQVLKHARSDASLVTALSISTINNIESGGQPLTEATEPLVASYMGGIKPETAREQFRLWAAARPE